MVESLHFDIQSTGQKSHCVIAGPRPSQCYVLIRQSDSPCPRQFWAGRSARAGRAGESELPRDLPGASAGGRRGPSAAPRGRRGQSPSVRGVGPRPDAPGPQSQSLSRSYGSVLPTSLIHVAPSARGCSPRRPAAVMGTSRRGRPVILPPADFQGTSGARRTRLAGAGLFRPRGPISGRAGSRARRAVKKKR